MICSYRIERVVIVLRDLPFYLYLLPLEELFSTSGECKFGRWEVLTFRSEMQGPEPRTDIADLDTPIIFSVDPPGSLKAATVDNRAAVPGLKRGYFFNVRGI